TCHVEARLEEACAVVLLRQVAEDPFLLCPVTCIHAVFGSGRVLRSSAAFESIDPLARRTFQANHCQFPLDNARGGGRVAHVSLHLQVAPRHVLKFVI
ncbi:hypothetical protein D6D08_04959, partial [Aureobasidium pullulans]